MPATRKPLAERYPHTLAERERYLVYQNLKWVRACLHGKVAGYDPNLGDRRKNLRRDCAKSVIRLVLNRYKAW
jgi:hypothetical protein